MAHLFKNHTRGKESQFESALSTPIGFYAGGEWMDELGQWTLIGRQ